MEYLQQRVESWIKDQRTKLLKVTWPQQWPIAIKWPWINGREHRKRMHEEYKRRKKQIHDLCIAVKADSLSDLQDILCCMVLSECVYKRPDAELIQAVNKFKADFGGQVVSLERIQPSSDHVPHRYLLAEAGDTLFASFIGTKQYKDVMADANILQGAIFHDDLEEDTDEILTNDLPQVDSKKKIADDIPKTLGAKPKQGVTPTKPAAHRGFMARAKGIPALELYRLAQKKKRKLVLCGHSLGGAVAVLATLAILRVIASASSSKEHERLNVKCITFSQPPVGNAALRNYVNEKGWQHYFKTYCIPEDLVPRILSPAYFHHYNSHTPPVPVNAENCSLSVTKKDARIERPMAKVKDNEGEQLVLGLGPVQNSFWRLSKLVPIEAVKRQFNKYRGIQFDFSVVSSSAAADSTGISSIEDTDDAPQSLEIQEDSDGISLKPLSTTDKGDPGERMTGNLSGKSKSFENHKTWRRVPTLPSYVPFGQLYLLGSSSVESLSGAEYSKLTSVKSVIAELRERLQSHSMRSYRSRFQRIYNTCMNDSSSSFLGMDQQQQFPQIQKWLGISLAGTIELGHIVESPVICTATSLVPLGWNGVPGEKNVGPIKVDITGIGLHLCTLVQARVNGSWCSTTVETFPTAPTNYSDHAIQPDLQKIRVLVGNPLRRPPKHQIATDPSLSTFPSMDTESADQNRLQNLQAFKLGKFVPPDDGLSEFVVFCTTDFSTISKEVHVRTRRVRLVGLEGAGKTSLLNAILDQGRKNVSTNIENFPVETDVQEGIAGGLCFTDSAGVNFQDLNKEASRFRNELWVGVRDLCTKTDLIILVHNLSHKIPRYSHSNASAQPALSFLLDEAKALGIPWVLAITNKFSVSAHQQKPAVEAVIHAYQASPSTTAIINSCPYVMPTAKSALTSSGEKDRDSHVRMGPHKFLYAPINLVRRPFQKQATILPVDGVGTLCQLVHRVLRSQEEIALQELAKDRLMLELARDRELVVDLSQDAMAKANSLTAAAVGASVGAGVGVVVAIVLGAASALRKP